MVETVNINNNDRILRVMHNIKLRGQILLLMNVKDQVFKICFLKMFS